MMEDDQLNVTEAPTDHNQNTQAESLLSSSNQRMEQSRTDSTRRQRLHQKNALKLKYFNRKCKNKLKKSRDFKPFSKEHLMLYNKFQVPLSILNQAWAAPLKTPEDNPQNCAVHIRDENDDTSSKSETLPMEQSGTLEPGPSKVTKDPVQNTKLRSKMLLYSQKKKILQKYADKFYQYLLSKI